MSQVFHACYGTRLSPGATVTGTIQAAGGSGHPALGYRGDVSERRWTGSRLTGARQVGAANDYPGERLGLPERGSGAVAGYGPRFVALFIDWALCSVIALTLLHSQWWTYAIFAAEVYLLTALTGFTVGMRLIGLRVVRLDGRPVGFVWALVRTVLLLAVIPAVVFDRDTRGLHDRAANTVVVRA